MQQTLTVFAWKMKKGKLYMSVKMGVENGEKANGKWN